MTQREGSDNHLVTLRLLPSTIAVLLEALLEEEARDRGSGPVYSRWWHRRQVIDAAREAMR